MWRVLYFRFVGEEGGSEKKKKKGKDRKTERLSAIFSQLTMGDCECVSLGQRVNRARNEGNKKKGN